VKRLIDKGVPIDGASDHGVSEAIYLHDPDGNGLEIYADRAREDWPRDQNGELRMVTEPLDFQSLMAELEATVSESHA
jgi:catechol 2,3-dioxygenase